MKIRNLTRRMLVLDLGPLARIPMTVRTVEPDDGNRVPMRGGGMGTRLVARSTRVNAPQSLTIPARGIAEHMPDGSPFPADIATQSPGVRRALAANPPQLKIEE